MNLIPASWKILWDAWQVQMLVLLSLTLQIILFVFGKRRKNMLSQWTNVMVWLAYTMANWVATVALGKLSHTLNNIPNPNNTLQALWAPLLLLHLGGPDTITAYSLNDNQLWIRHFLGMSVQATVAIYVIVMSWRHFWFSYMLIPAFMAGIIKYGERIWALKLACHDESKNIVPFYDLGVRYGLATKTRCEIVLITAHKLVTEFKDYMENYDIRRSFRLRYTKFMDVINLGVNPYLENVLEDEMRDVINLGVNPYLENVLEDEMRDVINLAVNPDFENVLEVEMGLMYDLLYTKAPITFTKRGCIFRSISFMCTVSVLVGLFRLIDMEAKWHKQHSSMVDIFITGVLLVGALALEIYAVMLLLFSDWAMLWLIKCGRGKWAILLLQKFSWFFEKKKWSKKMWQIDVMEKEDKHKKWSRIVGRLGIQDKFYRYMHSTSVCIPSTLYPRIFQFICSASATDNLLDFGWLEGVIGSTPFHELVFIMHIITDMCHRYDESESESDLESVACTSENSENSANSCGHDGDKETCKTLSNYMTYLLLTSRWLLPVVVKDSQFIRVMNDAKLFSRYINEQVTGGRMFPMDMERIEELAATRDEEGRKMEKIEETSVLLEGIFYDLIDEGNKEVKWEKLKNVWLVMLCYAAISCPKNYHLQRLREGGELLNFVWFLIPHAHIFFRVDTFKLHRFFSQCFQQGTQV
ncbi:uncharacterized protein LOC114292278 [Camellia sinensis]|uniref:DUF4220 domain-containing protein n=1 Tax=Camellia sinensis var. sinensis TaxID=542762 RepID=A0A4S4DLA8_CAMSN|nr:uncharacterized protein LOC114292278 [Camellia sinensis]XP_028091987.1 uncharacterized protein LOC114292278 [Camellia sinensis]THG03730.1 hypothetical protein TEA_021802 [Camellia sinensis var. sinensis]